MNVGQLLARDTETLRHRDTVPPYPAWVGLWALDSMGISLVARLGGKAKEVLGGGVGGGGGEGGRGGGGGLIFVL